MRSFKRPGIVALRGETQLQRCKLMLFAVLTAFGMIAICSKSSFLYPLNDWIDVNCFFTLGRGIKHGLIPYLDLYEQKGPLLYGVFYIAALISENSYVGVFVIEVLLFSWFLYECAMIVLLWDKIDMAYSIVPFISLGIVISEAFTHGTSSEELFLPVITSSLRITLQASRSNKPLSFSQAFLLGCAAGAALWVKYTFCGFFIGLAFAIVLWYVKGGHVGSLATNFAGAVAGVVAVSLIVLFWYWRKSGLAALIQTYFVDNLTLYQKEISPIEMLRYLGSKTLTNWPWTVPCATGILWMLHRYKQNKWETCIVLSSGFTLALFTVIGGRTYVYYFMILAVFVSLMVVPISECKFVDTIRVKGRYIAWLLLPLCTVISFFLCANTPMMKYEKQDTPQFAFAEIIKDSDPNATMLNYGFLDGGFYYAAGKLPENRYFCNLNIPNVEIMEEQNRLVDSGAVDFVVTNGRIFTESEHYQLVKQLNFEFEGKDITYCLHKKIE